MLGQQRERRKDDRRGKETGGTRGGGVLRKGLPFAAAFAAGVLLGRRRSGDAGEASLGESEEEAEGRLNDIAAAVRDRATAGETETMGWAEERGGAETGDAETGTQTPDSQAAVEQPGSMGSVAGEEERQREREEGSGSEDSGMESQGAETEGDGTEMGSEETESETGSEEIGYESREVDDEVAALSAPTNRGMPMLGLGTYQMEEYDECFESVRMALQMGYRHLDTAEGYHNETAVGDAIAEAEVDREDLFVATKVSPDNLDFDHVLTAAEESLDRLGLDYVDMLYVHWPTGEYEATDTLDAFAELHEEGMIEKIGVSNFTVELLEEAVEVSDEPIFANQVEMHPLLPQTELQEFCEQDDVDVELVAYSPIARGEVADVDELQEIADDYDATPVQISLAWLREKGATAIPKATSWDHMRENWLSLDLELDEEDVERIDDIDQRERLVDPDEGPWNQ